MDRMQTRHISAESKTSRAKVVVPCVDRPMCLVRMTSDRHPHASQIAEWTNSSQIPMTENACDAYYDGLGVPELVQI